MRCSHARKLMSAALDDELDAAGRDRLAAHVAGCDGCRREQARLEQVRALFAGAERFEPRAGLALRVAAAARAAERRRPSPLLAPARMLARAAALTAVVALGVVSGNVIAGAPGTAGGPAASALPSLEVFAAAPPDSPGGAYLAMLGDAHE